MGEFDEPDPGTPRETRRDDGTRRDRRVPGPRPAAETRREGAPPVGGSLLRLPAVLGERFEAVAELPVQGAESDLLLVRDEHGDEYVAKIFRRGYRADRDVWAKLPTLDSPHVLRILETGHADGRDYEVAAYAPDGNLRSLMGGGPLPVATATEIAAQLAEGLTALHRAGIVHRDLKPENVLVLRAEPVQLAIADFGLSKVLDQSVVFASSSRTLAYAAPESLSGQVSPARDWWSLGMIVRELATGRPPFQGLSETVVVDHLATRPVSADDVGDPRLRLLCRGLLARDPRRRWTGAQVREWLDGGAPAVAEEEAPPGADLVFKGARFTRRDELARVLVADWDDAARHFFERGESGPAGRSLREWLERLPAEHGGDGRAELLDERLVSPLPPDVKLLHLVRWLDPELPPHYLGRRLAVEDLPNLAVLAADRRHPDHRLACRIGRDLWERGLLRILAGFEGGRELSRVDDQWRAHATTWTELARWLRAQDATPAGLAARLPHAATDDPPTVLLTLLALAARPAETQARLAESAARARASVADPPPWFTWMADGAGDDPLRLLALSLAAPEAVLEAEARARDRLAAARQEEELRARWAERERLRLAGTNSAMTRAVLWTLPLLLFWLLGSWIADGLFGGDDSGTSSVGGSSNRSGMPFAVLVAASVLVWAVQCGSEVALARRQGADYLPHGPWSFFAKAVAAGGRVLSGVSRASQSMSGAARRTGRPGCGLLLIAGIVPLLLVLLLLGAMTPIGSLLWLLAMAAAAFAHAVTAGMRLHRWRESRRPGGNEIGGGKL
ncbi:protein kinase domain-containing protein [Actinomadura decatromicini]|uniref:Serine/threonine protein kinase n=1 Tax=Actinomadura decatromicini TaxID=2604572 RepID=A0A5D3FM07_9ACTN|nr:serine/threonine-protein kinase [Actinomadura decatromicini]TYK49253.1 serine/threonine protein kinase [Actinomadura decatromicini]